MPGAIKLETVMANKYFIASTLSHNWIGIHNDSKSYNLELWPIRSILCAPPYSEYTLYNMWHILCLYIMFYSYDSLYNMFWNMRIEKFMS